MVGTITATAHNAAIREIQELLYSNAERFVEADHTSGAVLVRFTPLARLVAELVTRPRAERAALWELLKRSVRTGIELAGHNTDLYREWFDLLCDTERIKRDVADLRAERDKLAGESDLREQEIIALTVERDKALARVSELEPDLDTPGGEA
jgi:hypothetical protein